MLKSIGGTDESDGQRERILRQSALLFAEKGYQAVGVAEIGDTVGLGRGALYYHIGSKEELLFDIIIKYITDLVHTGSEILRENSDPRVRIELLSQHMMKVISANLSEMTVCFRESDCLTGHRHEAVARLHSDYQALWARTLSDGHRDGVFRRLPPVALKGMLGMYFHSFLWFNPNGKISATQVGEVFADIVLRALAVDQQPTGRKTK
jgi:AcrR family transcriptional regulator